MPHSRPLKEKPIKKRVSMANMVPVLALLLVVVFIAMKGFGAKQVAHERFTIPASDTATRGILVKPYISYDEEMSFALDGGELPIFGQHVPRVRFGDREVKKPLQMAILSDWTSPQCRKFHKILQALYVADTQKKLPPLELYVLPLFFDAQGEAVHRAMLQVHFTSSVEGNFEALSAEINDGLLAPDPVAIKNRVAQMEPDLIESWNPDIEWMAKRRDKAFAIARAQLERNTYFLPNKPIPQLTSIDAILLGDPSADEIALFLHDAQRRQSEWLVEHPAGNQTGTYVRCDCKNPTHRHGSHLAQELQMKVTPLELSESMPAVVEPKSVSRGPQIHFAIKEVSAEPIAVGGIATATFHFENIGDATLEMKAFLTGCDCATVMGGMDDVPPGEKSSFTVVVDTEKQGRTDPGQYTHSIWVTTNSTEMEDPSSGHHVGMVITLIAAK